MIVVVYKQNVGILEERLMAKSALERLLALRHGIRGVITALQEETNLKIFIVWGALTVLVALYLQLGFWKIFFLSLSFMVMISAELFNSAIERIADMVQPKKDIRVKKIKDLSAAGVFLLGVFIALITLLFFI